MTADWSEQLQKAGLDPQTDIAPGILPQAFVAPVSDQCLLRIQGPDTRKFLQGQVTCDIQALSTEQSLTGAACDPKGRVYALFQLLALGEEDVLMQLPVAIADQVIRQMQKYLAFFKAEMSTLPEWFMLGLHGEEAVSALVGAEALGDTPGRVRSVSGGYAVARMPTPEGGHRHELWLDGARLDRLPELNVATVNVATESAAAWRRSRIESGLVALTPETAGAFLPQNLNLHALEGVSFNKGCYTGQEVVARMHFLGSLKKSLFRVRIDEAGEAAEPQARLESPEGKVLGSLVETVTDRDGICHGLAVLSHGVLDSGARLTGHPGARVTLESMGYTVPEQQSGLA